MQIPITFPPPCKVALYAQNTYDVGCPYGTMSKGIHPMQNLSGQSIKGYRLRDQIGSGGFGAVYRAYQAAVKREVAIKERGNHFCEKQPGSLT